ncbi:MAG TPA: hypothetical protein VNZ52_11740 [Candidatus Thermoplasmatota archaeon]|nr:hypothetical protein [Candidatus Thermoplasmatota archaeon]
MPRRVMSVVAVSVLAVVFLPWNAAVSYLDGLKTVMTLAWWRREAHKVASAAKQLAPHTKAGDW